MSAMLRGCVITATAIALAALAATPAAAADDDSEAVQLQTGKRLFAKCEGCHPFAPGEEHSTGPNLWRIFGRTAGTQPGFSYSDALRNSGIVWSEETLGKWLADPLGFIPGNEMGFVGLPRESDRRAVLAWLRKRMATD